MTLYHLRKRIEAIGFRIEELVLRIMHRCSHIDLATCPVPVACYRQCLDEHSDTVEQVHFRTSIVDGCNVQLFFACGAMQNLQQHRQHEVAFRHTVLTAPFCNILSGQRNLQFLISCCSILHRTWINGKFRSLKQFVEVSLCFLVLR